MSQGLAQRQYVGFPPGRTFLLLPARPARATTSGLALYDGVEPLQRLTLRAGTFVSRAHLGRLLPGTSAQAVSWDWWESFIDTVAAPQVGPVEHVAVRQPPNGRTSMLLLNAAGAPVGFAKLLDVALPAFSASVRAALTAAPMRWINVPRTLAEGQHDKRHYVLFEPLPEGPHRRPPFDPPRIAAIIDELAGRLASMPRPADVPDHHVICHTGFTPRNVRVVSGGGYWLYDWDYARWGPRMVPEVRYWSAEFAYRRRPDVPKVAAKIYGLLRGRAGADEIYEAATWSGSLPTYRAVERALHTAVGELASAEGGINPLRALR